METLLMPLGRDSYAVPIGWVREVVAAPALTPLVTSPPVVTGLFNLRGEIVPLLDTAALVGVRHGEPVVFAVVLNTPLGPVALGTTGLPRRAVLEGMIGQTELWGSAGTYRVDDDIVVLLDVRLLLESPQLGTAEPAPADDDRAGLAVRAP